MRILFLMFYFGLCAGYAFGQQADTTAAFQAYQTADRLANQAKYDSCLVFYQQAAEGYRLYALRLPDEHKWDLARTRAWERHFRARNQIGWNLSANGRRDAAVDTLETVLAETQARLGPKNFINTLLYSNLGSVYCDRRELRKALDRHEKSLALRLELYGPNYRSLSQNYHNIGNVYLLLGVTVGRYDLKEGAGTLTIDTNGWADGMYVCTFKAGDTLLATQKLIITKK